MPIRQRPEEQLQRAIVKLWNHIGRHDVQMQHDVSGMIGSETRRRIAKGLGNRAGWPDLTFVDQTGKAHFIECKGPDGRLTDAQRSFEIWCAAHRIPHIVCRSLDEAEAFFRINGLSRSPAKVAA